MTTWAPIVFWILLVPLLIILLIVYLKSKNLYRLVYIVTVFTYAMTIMYWIDAYTLGRNAIIGILVLSSLIMIAQGFAMHKRLFEDKPIPHLGIACVALIGILVITGISASSFGWQESAQAATSLSRQDVYRIQDENTPPQAQGPIIYTISVTSSIPRQYELPFTTACLYNSQNGTGVDVGTQWDSHGQGQEMLFGGQANVVEVFGQTKILTLRVYPYIQYKPGIARETPVQATPPTAVYYDQLLLFLTKTGSYEYRNCYMLLPQDIDQAIVIPLE